MHKRRIRMESCLSFKVWTHGFAKRDLREFLALSLREKRQKWSENSDFPWTRGKWEQESLWNVLELEKSQGRSEVELGDCMANQVLIFGLSTCMKLWHYELNSHWLHVGEISTILSHASCLIKIPTMYVIT